jgi:hypothetical protein
MGSDFRIPAPLFSTGKLSRILGLSRTTTCAWIDEGILPGFRAPTRRRDRRVTRQALIAFARRHPGFQYILGRIDGIDAADDFAEAPEPASPPTRPVRSGPPRSAHRPRRVFGGRIPLAAYYSASEIGYVLGRSRQCINSMLGRGILRGIQVPASGMSPWAWRIAHACLTRFLQENPAYRYAWKRLGGCEFSGEDRSPSGEIRTRNEPLLPPGAPGWRGHPHQTRRGGFKPGPKLPDGRQPCLTREDIAAREDANRPERAD